jgi:hypothetical protein
MKSLEPMLENLKVKIKIIHIEEDTSQDLTAEIEVQTEEDVSEEMRVTNKNQQSMTEVFQRRKSQKRVKKQIKPI